jgi:hypothetical protein
MRIRSQSTNGGHPVLWAQRSGWWDWDYFSASALNFSASSGDSRKSDSGGPVDDERRNIRDEFLDPKYCEDRRGLLRLFSRK